MALTRKFLAALGIESEKIDEIIDAHITTVNALKEERDTYKEDAEKLPTVQKELNDLKESVANGNDDAFKVKYEALKEDFDKYKSDIKEKETMDAKNSAYRALLKDAGVSEKRLESVLKVSNVKDLEFDEDGKLKDADKLKESIKTEWADFIVTTRTHGAQAATPPGNNGGTVLTKEQIYATDERGRYKLSSAERQEALRMLPNN